MPMNYNWWDRLPAPGLRTSNVMVNPLGTNAQLPKPPAGPTMGPVANPLGIAPASTRNVMNVSPADMGGPKTPTTPGAGAGWQAALPMILGMVAQAVDPNGVGGRLGAGAEQMAKQQANAKYMQDLRSGKTPEQLPLGVDPQLAMMGIGLERDTQRQKVQDERYTQDRQDRLNWQNTQNEQYQQTEARLKENTEAMQRFREDQALRDERWRSEDLARESLARKQNQDFQREMAQAARENKYDPMAMGTLMIGAARQAGVPTTVTRYNPDTGQYYEAPKDIEQLHLDLMAADPQKSIAAITALRPSIQDPYTASQADRMLGTLGIMASAPKPSKPKPEGKTSNSLAAELDEFNNSQPGTEFELPEAPPELNWTEPDRSFQSYGPVMSYGKPREPHPNRSFWDWLITPIKDL